MKHSPVALLLLWSALSLATACVGESKKSQEDDIRRLSAYILDAPPERISQRLDVNFDNKVTLLGYDIEPVGSLAPDGRVKLTLFWRCDKKLDAEWGLFTHVLDGSGERILNIDNVGPLRQWKDTRQALGPSAWQPGKIYVDEQPFGLPETLTTKEIQITTGLWTKGKRLAIVSGAHDEQQRAIVTTLKIEQGTAAATQAKTRVPNLRVPKIDRKTVIEIDGKLDDAAWQGAADTGAFVDVTTGQPNEHFPVNGRAKLLWSDEGIYFGFSVTDADIVGGFDKGAKDPHLWTRDTIEIMIDPDGDGDNKDYYEIQINPQNLVFDSQFDNYNAPKTEPDGPFGHQDWSAQLKSAVVLKGTLDKSDDKDEGYSVEALLPWKALSKAKGVPPKPGESWRINLYAMQKNGGVAWSPILKQGNFHKATRFGQVTWLGAGGEAPAASSVAPGATPTPPPAAPGAPPATPPAALPTPAAPATPSVGTPPPAAAAPNKTAPAAPATPNPAALTPIPLPQQPKLPVMPNIAPPTVPEVHGHSPAPAAS